MNRQTTRITVALLKLAQRLKLQFDQLEESGVRILQIEQAEFDVINLVLLTNGIRKDDESAAWIIEPLMQYVDGDIQMGECLRVLRERLQDLKRERVAGARARVQ